jgi:hypothetical protein
MPVKPRCIENRDQKSRNADEPKKKLEFLYEAVLKYCDKHKSQKDLASIFFIFVPG